MGFLHSSPSSTTTRLSMIEELVDGRLPGPVGTLSDPGFFSKLIGLGGVQPECNAACGGSMSSGCGTNCLFEAHHMLGG